MANCRDYTCICCEQVNDQLSLVVELKEKVNGLRSIRECKKELGWWSQTLLSLTSLGEGQQEAQEAGELMPSCCPERGDLEDAGNGSWSLSGEAGEPHPDLFHLLNCPYTTGLGL